MSTTTLDERPVKIVIPHEAAPHVAKVILGELSADLESVRIVQSRKVVENVRSGLEHDVALLDQLQWGEAPTDVTLSASHDELRKFAGLLMEGDSEIHDLAELREQARQIAAGAAILDQLEASR